MKCFPPTWRKATVIPIPKPGKDPLNQDNGAHGKQQISVVPWGKWDSHQIPGGFLKKIEVPMIS